MRENVSLLLNGAEDLVSKDMKNAKALNAFFALVFISKICLQESQTPEANGKSEARYQAGEHLNNTGHKQVSRT